MKLANNIALWRLGKITYNDRLGTFISASDIYERTGHARCNVYVKNVASVKPVVKQLRQMGYATEDSLEEQEGLRKMGKSLTFLVTLLVFGSVVGGMLNVLITTWLNTKTKMYEIGILRAYGGSRRTIVGMYLKRAFLLGICSFVPALVLAALLEPQVRLLLGMFYLPLSSIVSVSIVNIRFFWLHAVALLVCMLCSVLGVMLSVWRTCKPPIRELLQRRE